MLQKAKDLYYQFLANLDQDWAWIAQIFVVVLLTLIFSYLVGRILKKVHAKLGKTKNLWDDALIYSVRKPLKLLIWIVGLTYALDIVNKEADAAILQAVPILREIGVILAIAWFLNRFINMSEQNIIQDRVKAGKSIDKSTADAIAKLLKVAVIITAALIVLQTLGFSISGVLAFGGIGGVAVGFASKDLLSNFFGALMIHLDRPFKIGDWIRSPDRSIEGTVEEIGWRQTRIRTFDKRPLYVPNALFTTIAVENPSRMSNRRIYETIGIRYDDMKKAEKIVDQVKEMLSKHKEIDENQTLIVNLNEFSASSVDFFIYCFTHTTDWIKFHEIKQDVLLQISAIIDKNKAEIAFPTSTVHVPGKVKLDAPQFAGLAKAK